MTQCRKLIQLIFILLSSNLQLSNALAFAASTDSATEEQQQQQQQEEKTTIKTAVRGAATQITKSSHLNDAVDSFFLSNEDPTDLTSSESQTLHDEIQLLANTEALKSFLVSVRRQLHKHPEVMYQGEYIYIYSYIDYECTFYPGGFILLL
jgi:hypothetical protein